MITRWAYRGFTIGLLLAIGWNSSGGLPAGGPLGVGRVGSLSFIGVFVCGIGGAGLSALVAWWRSPAVPLFPNGPGRD